MGEPLQFQFTELFSFVINTKITLKQVMEQQELSHILHRPLSLQAFNQFKSLQTHIQSIPPFVEQDKWCYTWPRSQFSSMRMYKNICAKNEVHSIFKQIWKTSCRPRHKIFFCYYCMTGLAQGTSFNAEICSFLTIHVPCVRKDLMKHSSTYSGTALSH